MNNNLTDRVNDIESSIGLLQRDYEAQNESILWLTSRVQELEKTLNRVASQVGSLQDGPSPDTLPDEQPPHY